MKIVTVVVEGRVATAFDADGFPIGEWEASATEMEWAGYGPTQCPCGELECRHGHSHYWGIGPSFAEMVWLASHGRYIRPY